MIGLIFGEKNFPIEILKKIKKKKIKYLIIDLSKKKKFKNDKNTHIVSGTYELLYFGGPTYMLGTSSCHSN